MAKEIQLTGHKGPNYEKIYREIIEEKGPFKKREMYAIFTQKNIKAYDIIKLDLLLSGVPSKEERTFNQQHRAYDEDTIKYILKYQSEYALSNIKTSEIFNVSRNTISKWRKLFG